jgi:aspartate/methionine/tyrosine aminotransferase
MTDRLHKRPQRLADIAGIGVDRMGAIADRHDALLRLENLDTDIAPDAWAIDETRRAAAADDANSYLPFVGRLEMRRAAARHVARLSGVAYDGERNVIVCAGGLSGILNVLLATVEVGDEVVVTDPTYAGLINRVRLAGGVPRFAPLAFTPGEPWRLDRDGLRQAIGPRTRAMLLMSPSMPTGAVLDGEDWALVAELCRRHDLLLIYDAAMERLLFDGRELLHPAALPGMAERTITIGSASKELRMIGWRVGWIVSPESFMPDLVAVSLANVVVPVGIAQDAAALALGRSGDALPRYVGELQRRRDALLTELAGLPVGVPAGGWSLLLRVDGFGLDGPQLSTRLLDHGIAATAMAGWGQLHDRQHIRFVFSNEPAERLRGAGEKIRRALQA